jgi:E3 ubiquitin-protein ligase RNF19A
MCLCEVADAAADGVVLEPCGHLVCRTCLLAYADVELGDGRFRLRCPELDCRAEIAGAQLQAVLPPEGVDKYLRFSLRGALATLPNVRTCPGDNCPYAVEIGPAPAAAALARLGAPLRGLLQLPPAPERCVLTGAHVRVHCAHPDCGVDFCGNCGRHWHEGVSCAARATVVATMGTDQPLEQTSDAGGAGSSNSSSGSSGNGARIKPCPVCKVAALRQARVCVQANMRARACGSR